MTRRTGFTIIVPIDGLAGSHVKDVAEDMIVMAKRLKCGVTLNMNGVHLIAFPHTTVNEIRKDYELGLERS